LPRNTAISFSSENAETEAEKLMEKGKTNRKLKLIEKEKANRKLKLAEKEKENYKLKLKRLQTLKLNFRFFIFF